MKYLIYYLLIVNALGLLLMLMDKQNAIKKRHRVPEVTLLGLGLLGGSAGCYLGMHLFRHKTNNPAFSMGLPAMIVLNTIVFWYLSAQLS